MKIRGQTVYPLRERIEMQSIPEPNSGCWLWTGAIKSDRQPYGSMTIGSRTDGTRSVVRAHRIAFEAFHGPIPDGMEVCHSCDMPICVNPDHLFAGTRQDNVDDRERKGRNSLPPVFRGENAPWAKLSDADVAAIRISSLSSKATAKKYNIGDSYVRQLRRWEYRKLTAPPSDTRNP